MTGQALIDRMVAFLKRYIVLDDGQALACALWALNTWTYDKFAAVPYLEIWAMHKRSGKTTLAECLAAMSRGGSVLATFRALQMVRILEAKDGHYTPFIEEAERFWKGGLGDERSILATGYRRGAAHELATSKGVMRFRTFGPKAFVLIGNVHDVLRDRCVSVKLERGTPVASWTLEREIGETEANAIVEDWYKVARTVTDIKPIDPLWLHSPRDRELWTPLFSMAAALKLDKATWERLQAASMDMSALKTLPAARYQPAQDEQVADDMHAAEAALRDARLVLKDGETKVTNVDLVERMRSLPTGPWRSWRGAGLDVLGLAALFSRFGLETKAMRFGKSVKGSGANVHRGYDVAAIKAVKL